MKVTVDEQKKSSADGYPKLMVAESGTFVFFKESRIGIALNDAGSPAGYFSETWDMNTFTDFHGTITLESD